MKIILISSILFLLTNIANAKCFKIESSQLKWTAFKTADKKPVSGTFKSIKYPKQLDINSKGHFNLSVVVDTKTVDTKNSKRDVNLTTAFFALFDNSIFVSMNAISNKKINATIKMNGKSMNIPFSYSKKSNSIEGKGKIDLFKFALSSQLARLTKKCFTAHEGKTWNDVSLEFKAKLISCSK